MIRLEPRLGCLVQSVTSLSADPWATHSIHTWSNTFVKMDHGHSPPFHEKVCCQLQAKVSECVLVSSLVKLAQEKGG